MHRARAAALLVVILGCTGARPAPACGNHRAKGHPSQLTIRPGAPNGPQIDPPQTCRGRGAHVNGVYIAVHGPGHRGVVLRPDRETCTAPPAEDAKCTTVSYEAFGRAITARMTAMGITGFGGPGLGVCASSQAGELDPSKLAMEIIDWRDADRAIHAVDAELRRWGVTGFAVAVLDDDCVVAEDR